MSTAKQIKECMRAIQEVLDAWEEPDSPEALVYAMKGLRNIYNEIKAHL